MNLYIYNYQEQQIGIIEETEDRAARRYALWAKRYQKDLGDERLRWTKCVNSISPGLVIESLNPYGGDSGFDAYWGAVKD